jgi:hypothetical protein
MIKLYYFPLPDPSIVMRSSVKKTEKVDDKVESPEATNKKQRTESKSKKSQSDNANLKKIKEEEEDDYDEKDEKESSGVFPGLKVANAANSAPTKPKKPQPTHQELEGMVHTMTTLILAAKEKKATSINDPEQIRLVLQHSQTYQTMLNDKKTQQVMTEFFSAAGFIKRLKTHMECSKSSTKRKLTLSMYHKQLRPMDRQLNLLDYIKTENNEEKLYDGKGVEELLLIYADI